ncbi:MAG TPA: cysteine--tRNA ligase [Elusimicrobia bacterium]|nr:cysteine--tRNA ligase [Elusimicrobiota bacterium]HBT60640.1 cysteine--tRNA ligase [Elusimicrobiota bacterium]
MKVYNTLSRCLEELQPLDPPRVGLYTCGPTVYNYQHIGNYRTYIFEDALKRTLKLCGFQVRHVMNITDVGHLVSQADEGEDKMEVGASREGKTAWEIARIYTEAFLRDCRDLNLLAPDVLCKATDHIPEQIALIERLREKGLIYGTSDGLYYDTAKFPSYGRLAGESHIAGIREGSRVGANPEKRAPTDFAVWKFSPKGQRRQMEWDSPWGVGFPGWHLECSAMAMKYLGESFDVHCGGVDHVSIHHTNEIAQAEGATGQPFVRYWMHGEFLLMNNAKMAKSAGGFVTIAQLKEKGFDPLDYRYHCLTAHYRKQLDFTWEALESSKVARRRLCEAVRALPDEGGAPAPESEFGLALRGALADDLNTAGALAALWDGLRGGLPGPVKRCLAQLADEALGLGLFAEAGRELPADLRELLERRAKARQDKDFALSDSLRRELEARRIVVEDTKQGQRWRRK